jgi:hypothetical protein
MGIPVAIVIGALIVGAAIAFTFRWELVVGPNRDFRDLAQPGIYRLDRWSGAVAWCATPQRTGLIRDASSVDCESR